MENPITTTLDLVSSKKTLEKQLAELTWGSIEIRCVKGDDYIYLHRRESGIGRTFYVGKNEDVLYNQILRNNIEARTIKREIRAIDAELKKAGYTESTVSEKVQMNIDFAKRSMADTIYKQAVLEGVAVTFLDTERIIEGGKINNISADDVQKINNLKHTLQFILDEGVVTSPSGFHLLCLINKLVEEGFHFKAGSLRTVPVSIGGTTWKPDLPIESLIKEQLADLLSISDIYDRAISSLLFISKKQLFLDGNKRTSVIFANHILVSAGAGLLAIPEAVVPEYRRILLDYYESDNDEVIKHFLYDCITKLT